MPDKLTCTLIRIKNALEEITEFEVNTCSKCKLSKNCYSYCEDFYSIELEKRR
jgi:hypothetical protein